MLKNKLLDGIFVTKDYINKKLARGDIWYCYYCNEYHSKTIPKYRYNYIHNICKLGCYKAYYCESCGDRFSGNNLSRQYGCCSACASYEKLVEKTKVNSYHYQPEVRFYTQPEYYVKDGKDFKGCGIELEVDIGGERNDMSAMAVNMLKDEIYVKHDGSLCNGFEIVTYPHTYEALMSMNWKNTLRELMLYGYKSHDSNRCGLHMHISRTLFNQTAVPKLMYFYDKFRNDLLLFARRDRERADRWARAWITEPNNITYDNECEKYATFNECGRHDYRYRAVNIINRNTVEIRLVRGTLNYDSFSACCEFIYKTALNANNVTNLDDLSQWFKGLSENCLTYMKKRHCFSDYLGGGIIVEREEGDDYEGDDLICA